MLKKSAKALEGGNWGIIIQKSANLNMFKKLQIFGGEGCKYQNISQKSANLNMFKKMQFFKYLTNNQKKVQFFKYLTNDQICGHQICGSNMRTFQKSAILQIFDQ